MSGANVGQLNRLVMRPGPGWSHLGGPVWEHANGARIHWSGQLVRLSMMPRARYIQSDLYRHLIRINGGNKKRGTMAFALTMEAHNARSELPAGQS